MQFLMKRDQSLAEEYHCIYGESHPTSNMLKKSSLFEDVVKPKSL
jgi:hypothetical protein